MGEDRRTRAELLEALREREQELEETRALAARQVDRADDRAREAIEGLDLEARVISDCAKAMSRLGSRRSTVMYSDERPSVAAVERILSHLAMRYGIPDPHAEIERLRREVAHESDRRMAAESSLEEIRDLIQGAL